MKLKLFYTWIFFFTVTFAMFAQNIEVSGTVKDEKGEPLLGVLILVKGTQHGAATDMDGKYTIQTKVGDVLQYSFLGMKTTEKKITASSKHLDIVMKDDVQELEEMVVTGYGAPKLASRTVAQVAQVSSKDLNNAPVASVSDALQGRLAGVVVSSSSGRPGSNSEIIIHGYNNFQAVQRGENTHEPLYIMDGVAVSSSVMSDFNPNDIETITVLKDAASTSVYGARAANGVILITTKKGRRNERTSITVSHQLGFSALTSASRKFFDNMMTPREYMDFWLEKDPTSIISAAGMSRMGSTREVAEAAANKILQENPYNTRWDKIYFRDFVPMSRTDVSLSGGTESTSYYLSLGYFNQEGSSNPSVDYKRYTLNTNIDTRVTKWLKVGLSLSAGHSERDGSSGDITARVTALPFYSPTYPDGSRKDYITSITRNSSMGFYHPEYYAEKHPRTSVSDDFLPSGYITIEPIKNLIFKTQGGIQYGYSDSEAKELPSFLNYRQRVPAPTSNPFTRFSTDRSLRKTLTNTLEYRFWLGNKKEHSFNFLIGQESIENTAKNVTVTAYGQAADGLSTLMQGNKNKVIEDDKSANTFNSYLGRFEYSYNNRYFLDLSGRRDGSSGFGAGHRYGNFWAVGVMWKLKQEKFLKEVKWLSDLNLRFSTGLSGNSIGGGYKHLTSIKVDDFYEEKVGYSVFALGNPYLHWEEQRKTTVGLNIVIDRGTSFNIEYYDRETYDMLSSRSLNSTSGQNQFFDNAGGMRNRGIDFTFSSVVYRSKNNDLSIRPYFNVNYNKQEVTSLFGNKISDVGVSGVGYKIGRPLEWGAVIRKGVNPTTGETEYYVPGEDRMEQVTDDNKVTNAYDANKLIQTTGKKMQAPINGGFGWSINYKTFTVDMAFSFSLGRYMMNYDVSYTENPARFGYSNLSRNVFDYWKKPGDETRHPKITSNAFVYGLDSRLLQDASYVRMKSIGLSYRLPKEVIDQVKFFEGVRFHATARNIFTFTKYEGPDPESSSAISLGGYPPSRQFTLGIDLNF